MVKYILIWPAPYSAGGGGIAIDTEAIIEKAVVLMQERARLCSISVSDGDAPQLIFLPPVGSQGIYRIYFTLEGDKAAALCTKGKTKAAVGFCCERDSVSLRGLLELVPRSCRDWPDCHFLDGLNGLSLLKFSAEALSAHFGGESFTLDSIKPGEAGLV